MVCQEITIWFILYWHSNLLAADASNLLVKILLRYVFSQSRRELNGIIVRRDGEKAFVRTALKVYHLLIRQHLIKTCRYCFVTLNFYSIPLLGVF